MATAATSVTESVTESAHAHPLTASRLSCQQALQTANETDELETLEQMAPIAGWSSIRLNNLFWFFLCMACCKAICAVGDWQFHLFPP
jgi:hypothetical protein